ncbi:MAG: hypothetical protein ACI8ZB_003931 [Desulforhopalus sp.]|jgi:hypothetical protein
MDKSQDTNYISSPSLRLISVVIFSFRVYQTNQLNIAIEGEIQ